MEFKISRTQSIELTEEQDSIALGISRFLIEELQVARAALIQSGMDEVDVFVAIGASLALLLATHEETRQENA